MQKRDALTIIWYESIKNDMSNTALIISPYERAITQVIFNGKWEFKVDKILDSDNKLISCTPSYKLAIPNHAYKRKICSEIVNRSPKGKIDDYDFWLLEEEEAKKIVKSIIGKKGLDNLIKKGIFYNKGYFKGL